MEFTVRNGGWLHGNTLLGVSYVFFKMLKTGGWCSVRWMHWFLQQHGRWMFLKRLPHCRTAQHKVNLGKMCGQTSPDPRSKLLRIQSYLLWFHVLGPCCVVDLDECSVVVAGFSALTSFWT